MVSDYSNENRGADAAWNSCWAGHGTCGDDSGMPCLSALSPLACATPPKPPKPLSERERDCLRWAAEGKTSWETARILDISEHTVNFHVKNACRKLGVRTRRAAAVMAVQRQMLDPITDAPVPRP